MKINKYRWEAFFNRVGFGMFTVESDIIVWIFFWRKFCEEVERGAVTFLQMKLQKLNEKEFIICCLFYCNKKVSVKKFDS